MTSIDLGIERFHQEEPVAVARCRLLHLLAGEALVNHFMGSMNDGPDHPDYLKEYAAHHALTEVYLAAMAHADTKHGRDDDMMRKLFEAFLDGCETEA